METPFQDQTALTRWVRGLLLIGAALGVAAFVADLYERLATNRSDDRLDTIQAILAGTQLVVLIATICVAAVWIYKSARNVRALGARDLSNEPIYAVGWYFLPIANLFKPYQAMSEIWRASADPAKWREVDVPVLLPLWWAAWLASNFLSPVVARLPDNDGPATVATILLTAVSDAADVASDLAFFTVVGALWNLQSKTHLRTTVDEVFLGPVARDP